MIAMKKKECDSFCKIYFEVSSDETVVLGVLGFFFLNRWLFRAIYVYKTNKQPAVVGFVW